MRSSPAQAIQVQVNGEFREVPPGLSLADLVDLLGLPGDRVAVERNREIVPRGRLAAVVVEDGDRLEIVQFVGGG